MVKGRNDNNGQNLRNSAEIFLQNSRKTGQPNEAWGASGCPGDGIQVTATVSKRAMRSPCGLPIALKDTVHLDHSHQAHHPSPQTKYGQSGWLLLRILIKTPPNHKSHPMVLKV